MKLDTASDVSRIEPTKLRELLDTIWGNISEDWEEHPSYSGQTFMSVLAVHCSLTTLDIVDVDEKIDIYNLRARIKIDVSIASALLKSWESKGWIKCLDTDLNDYTIVDASKHRGVEQSGSSSGS